MAKIIGFPHADSKISDDRSTEKCALCGIDTQIPKNRPVDLRDFWVDGAGQLCSRCYLDTYGCK